jgi:hypothetical protein
MLRNDSIYKGNKFEFINHLIIPIFLICKSKDASKRKQINKAHFVQKFYYFYTSGHGNNFLQSTNYDYILYVRNRFKISNN